MTTISNLRIVMQRVCRASVAVGGKTVGSIDGGLCLLVGVAPDDTEADVDAAVQKISGLRVFRDDEDRMNLSLEEASGAVLVVSQFTLLGAVRKGRRPSFAEAAPPEVAEPLMERMVQAFRNAGIGVATGQFGAHMRVEIVNDGPVTLVLEVRDGRVV